MDATDYKKQAVLKKGTSESEKSVNINVCHFTYLHMGSETAKNLNT